MRVQVQRNPALTGLGFAKVVRSVISQIRLQFEHHQMQIRLVSNRESCKIHLGLSEVMSRVDWQLKQLVGRLKVATNMQDVKNVFNERFHKWGIHLPEEDLHQRKRGRIQNKGWSINYHFNSSDGKEYIEYFSSHKKWASDALFQ